MARIALCVARYRADASTPMRPAAVSLRRFAPPAFASRSTTVRSVLRRVSPSRPVLRRAPLRDVAQRPFSTTCVDLAVESRRVVYGSVRSPVPGVVRARRSRVGDPTPAPPSRRRSVTPRGRWATYSFALLRRPPRSSVATHRACSERGAVGACRRLRGARSGCVLRPRGEGSPQISSVVVERHPDVCPSR